MTGAVSIDYPRAQDADPIKAIQDSWLGARVGSEGFLTNAESLDRLHEMIESKNILVARRNEEILSYLTYYRRAEWEALHAAYTANLDYTSPELRDEWLERDYVVIDHIARNKAYPGDASVRLVMHLKRLLVEWRVGYFLGEISPDNQRSAAFFTKVLNATLVGSTTRADVPWDIYAASASAEPSSEE